MLIKNWDRLSYRLEVLRKGSLCIPVRRDYQVLDPSSQLCMEIKVCRHRHTGSRWICHYKYHGQCMNSYDRTRYRAQWSHDHPSPARSVYPTWMLSRILTNLEGMHSWRKQQHPINNLMRSCTMVAPLSRSNIHDPLLSRSPKSDTDILRFFLCRSSTHPFCLLNSQLNLHCHQSVIYRYMHQWERYQLMSLAVNFHSILRKSTCTLTLMAC